MNSPANVSTPTDRNRSETETPRSHRRLARVALSLLALTAVAMATTSCTPEEIAKDAIYKHFGPVNGVCAERIVHRESRFQAEVVNPRSGTTGLFQIHPVHAGWIRDEFGYSMNDLKDPYRNAEVAHALAAKAYKMYGDGWQPWRGNATGCAA